MRSKGLRTPAVLVCSDRAHYACLTVANWLGLGEENVVQVPPTTTKWSSRRFRLAVARCRPAAGASRVLSPHDGTTDAFGLDDLAAMVRVRTIVRAVHADAVIGWAWSGVQRLQLRGEPARLPHRALAGTSRRIRHLGLADSLGVDYHKTGFAPTLSSAVLLRDGHDFACLLLRREEETPHLFQSGVRHPADTRSTTTRAGRRAARGPGKPPVIRQTAAGSAARPPDTSLPEELRPFNWR